MATDMLSSTPDIIAARVLIVDDNPGTAETLARAISRISPSLNVLSATDAEAALKQLNGESVDLVITDMMMPGMNGLELIDRLRQRSPGNRLYSILITAYDVPGLRESARRMKVNDVLIKPFSPERLCQIARRALERSRPFSVLPGQNNDESPRFKILATDDNPSNLALLLRYLQQEEYQVLTASNGVEALQMLQAETFDLLLLDVNMPEMDGFQVLETMRSTPSLEHIPVIIVTAARLDPVDMQYALNTGADDYITKPFDRRELLARIRTRLRIKEAEDRLRQGTQRFERLLKILQKIYDEPSISELVDFLPRQVLEMLGASTALLILEQSKEILVKAYPNSVKPHVNQALSSLDGSQILSQLASSNADFVIDDARLQMWLRDIARATLAAPICWNSELLGAFLVTHEKQPGYFSQEHGLLLQAVAEQTALVVENNRLSDLVAVLRNP